MNPYEVLGVPQGADEETIKKAYKELVKKYHPDQYANNPLSDLAEEKLKEINEAYDMLINQKGGRSQTGGGYSGSHSYGGNGSFAQIRQLIQSGRITEAEHLLDGMSDRSAEWNYLKGIVALQRGWFDRAIAHLNTAVQMEPGNFEYRNALSQLQQRTASYRNVGNAGGYGRSAECDCCTNLICADCCCECMGGDLISCC